MAVNPEDYLSTPSGYATPQQLDTVRQIAAALMKPQQGEFMQSRLQPAAQIVNALLGAKLMQNANARDMALTSGLSMGAPVPATLPSSGGNGPGPQASVGGSDPASIRYNNPGAQWPGPSASNYGSTGYGVIGGGNKIAQFPDAESGAAAQFDLLARNYTGMRLADAVHKWSGGNSSQAYTAAVSQATGLSPDTMLTPQMLSNPGVAVPLAKTMAQFETGKPYPLSDEQWQAAHARVFRGATQTAEGGPVRTDAGGAPQSPASAQTQPPVPPTGQGPQPTPGAPTTQQMTPPATAGLSAQGGPANQFNEYIPRGAVRVPPEVPLARIQALYALRSPEALKLASELQAQNVQRALPQTIEYQGGHLVIPDPINHPEQQMFLRGVPTIQRGKAGDVEAPIGSTYTDQYGQTHVQPLIQDQPVGGGTPGVSFTQGGSSGGMPDSPRPTLGGMADFGLQMKGREAQAQSEGKAFASEHIGLRATAENLAQQMPILQVAKSILNDDSFYSGTAADAVLKLRRAGVAVNQEAQDAATPMEVFNKVISANILQQTNQLKAEAEAEGFQNNRLFRQQVGLMEKAAQSSDNTRSGNMYLTNFLMWQANRARKIADLADNYAATHGGGLDAGWGKVMRDKLFDDPEYQLSKEFQFPHPAAAQVGNSSSIPQAAIDYLKANPHLRDAFESKYGTGAANKALGGK